jgi:hypothetical protein
MKDFTRMDALAENVGSPSRLDGVMIGIMTGFAPDGWPLVDFAGNPQDYPIPAGQLMS